MAAFEDIDKKYFKSVISLKYCVQEYENQKNYYRCSFPYHPELPPCSAVGTLAEISEHMCLHTNLYRFKCLSCGRKFGDEMSFYSHRENFKCADEDWQEIPHTEDEFTLHRRITNIWIQQISKEEFLELRMKNDKKAHPNAHKPLVPKVKRIPILNSPKVVSSPADRSVFSLVEEYQKKIDALQDRGRPPSVDMDPGRQFDPLSQERCLTKTSDSLLSPTTVPRLSPPQAEAQGYVDQRLDSLDHQTSNKAPGRALGANSDPRADHFAERHLDHRNNLSFQVGAKPIEPTGRPPVDPPPPMNPLEPPVKPSDPRSVLPKAQGYPNQASRMSPVVSHPNNSVASFFQAWIPKTIDAVISPPLPQGFLALPVDPRVQQSVGKKESLEPTDTTCQLVETKKKEEPKSPPELEGDEGSEGKWIQKHQWKLIRVRKKSRNPKWTADERASIPPVPLDPKAHHGNMAEPKEFISRPSPPSETAATNIQYHAHDYAARTPDEGSSPSLTPPSEPTVPDLLYHDHDYVPRPPVDPAPDNSFTSFFNLTFPGLTKALAKNPGLFSSKSQPQESETKENILQEVLGKTLIAELSPEAQKRIDAPPGSLVIERPSETPSIKPLGPPPGIKPRQALAFDIKGSCGRRIAGTRSSSKDSERPASLRLPTADRWSSEQPSEHQPPGTGGFIGGSRSSSEGSDSSGVEDEKLPARVQGSASEESAVSSENGAGPQGPRLKSLLKRSKSNEPKKRVSFPQQIAVYQEAPDKLPDIGSKFDQPWSSKNGNDVPSSLKRQWSDSRDEELESAKESVAHESEGSSPKKLRSEASAPRVEHTDSDMDIDDDDEASNQSSPLEVVYDSKWDQKPPIFFNPPVNTGPSLSVPVLGTPGQAKSPSPVFPSIHPPGTFEKPNGVQYPVAAQRLSPKASSSSTPSNPEPTPSPPRRNLYDILSRPTSLALNSPCSNRNANLLQLPEQYMNWKNDQAKK